MQIVLQLPKHATQGMSAGEICSRARDYDGMVAYALIDPSGGLGRDIDMGYSKSLIFRLSQAMPHTTIGFAGGQSGENITQNIEAVLLSPWDHICCDAQGKLRAEDKKHFDMDAVNAYVHGAAVGFGLHWDR